MIGGTWTYKKLLLADWPELHTKVLYSRGGVCPAQAKGMVLLYAGTSSKINSEAGLLSSMGPVAMELVSMGYAVLAFQPPIYWRAEDDEARLEYVKKYGKLDDNLEWYGKTVNAAIVSIPSGMPLYTIALSTFGAFTLEAIHRAAQGNANFDYVRRFRRALIVGLEGHTPAAIERWHQWEVDNLLPIEGKQETNTRRGDRPVLMAAPGIFAAMGFQTQSVTGIRGAFPEVLLAAGARDLYGNSDVRSMLQPHLDFARQHHGIASTIAWHDGAHNPALEVKEEGRVVVPSMNRMKLLIEELTGKTMRTSTDLRTLFVPSPELVVNALPGDGAAVCRELLGMTAGTVIIPDKAARNAPGNLRYQRYMLEPDVGSEPTEKK